MSEVIQWEEPTVTVRKSAGPPSKYAPIFEALKERPGAWAVIAEGQANRSQVSRLKRIYPGFEMTTRPHSSGEGYNIFARFDPQEAAA